ncbi:hypothetical protein SRHO_G00231880 [Serrasalmus rhombeus]
MLPRSRTRQCRLASLPPPSHGGARELFFSNDHSKLGICTVEEPQRVSKISFQCLGSPTFCEHFCHVKSPKLRRRSSRNIPISGYRPTKTLHSFLWESDQQLMLCVVSRLCTSRPSKKWRMEC